MYNISVKILGIDPGIARCGWGIVEAQSSPARNATQSVAGGKFKVQSFGCVETKVGTLTEKRLLIVHEEIIKLINKYKPDSIAVEELFFNTNAKTALVVGQARGVVLLASAKQNIPVFTYTPLQIKVAITGYGRAEKNQIGQMVKTLLKLKEIPKPDDVTDALAVALTHSFTKRFK